MAANPPGMPGSLFDPSANNELGGLSTGIGYGTNTVYGPPAPVGMDDGEGVEIQYIGSPNKTLAQPSGFAGKPAKFITATSDVAVGGSMPDGSTNLSGKPVPAGAAVLGVLLSDSDATDWVTRTLANGGTVSAATATAVDTFVKAAKANGYWTKLQRINLMCGTGLKSCLTPLKIGGGNASDVNMNGAHFVEADYSEATGLQADGAQEWLDTGFICSTVPGVTLHMSYYSRSSSGNGNACMGISDGTNRATFYDLTGGRQIRSDFYDFNNGSTISSAIAAGPIGHIVSSRMSNVDQKIYRKGVEIGNNALTITSVKPGTYGCYIFGYNSTGSIGQLSNQLLAGYSIGDGLTAAEALAYYTDLQAFQTALGRAV